MMSCSRLESKSSRFGEDFFNSGKRVPGTFEDYSFDAYCAFFGPLCGIIVKHFSPHRVLDIGCAKGSMVNVFRELGVEAFGVDVSEYAIYSAPKSLRPYLYVVDLDKDSLPFEDGFFDFVTFFGSIEYLKNHQNAIANLTRVMADGGSLLLTTIYRRPKGDSYRLNVHSKDFWLKEFGKDWVSPTNYYNFMTDYFLNSVGSKSTSIVLKKLFFGKSKFTDRFLCFLYDVSAKLRTLNYGVILLTLHKSRVDD